jgi:hypothetical protein
VRDKILTRVLINERYSDNLKVMLFMLKDANKPELLSDSYKEYFFRNLVRDFLYTEDKAKEVMKLHGTLEEAKKFIGD